MKKLVLSLALLSGIFAYADELKTDPKDPEIFKLKISPSVNRCLEDKRGIDHCTSAKGLAPVEQLTLTDCNNENAFGQSCTGSYKQTIRIDGLSYLLRVDVSHFVNPNFKYMTSIWVCRGDYNGQCARSTLYTKDANLPSFWVNGPVLDKGKHGKYNLWYSSGIQFGDQIPF